jgi:Ice-binding-like
MRALYLLVFSITAVNANALFVPLGTADPFAVLAGSTITNTGPSVIGGDVGLWPGTAITGFPPGIVTPPGTIHATDAVALQAQIDLTKAWNFAGGEACDQNLTGQDLGGLTLTPGVYCFSSSAQLTGTLTLDAKGDPNAVFLFQIGSTLTTASASAVNFINGGEGDSLFWQVGSSATLGTTTAFAGNIMAAASITLNTGATIQCGRALAQSGAVTLDTNQISIDTAGCEISGGGGNVPEPGNATTLGTGLLFGLGLYAWRSRRPRSGFLEPRQ